MSNAVVNRQINVYINSGEAQKAYDILIEKEKLLNAELKKTTDPHKIKDLNAELSRLREPIDRATKKLKGEMAPSMRELEAATKKFLNEFKKTGSPESLANFQKFRSELNAAKAQINGLEAAQKGITTKGIFSAAFWANLAAGAVAMGARAIGGFFRGVVQEALDADASARRLHGTLDNLGRGDVFDRISRKATELAQAFRYLDNDDIVAVFNKLIDYGKLTEKEMNDLLPVIINFAAKAGISIEESASVIVKALEGNAKGLKEYGINVKEAGSESERLSIIMTTLKSKVDGSGEAFQNSAAGGIAVFRQSLKDLQEQIGAQVLPALNKLLSFTLKAGKNIKTFFQAIGDEFKGKSGFIRIALEEVDMNDPDIKIAVDDIAEQTLEGFKQLNKWTKDKKELERIRTERLDGIKKAIAEGQATIAELQKSSGRGGQGEAKSSLIGILGRQKGLEQIEAFLSPGSGNLGISQPGSRPGRVTSAVDKRKQELEAYAAFLKKIKELNEDFDISQMEGFEKDLALLQKKKENLEEEAKKFKNNKEALLSIDELYKKEALLLIDKYEKLDKEKYDAAAKKQAEGIYNRFVQLAEALKAGFAILNEDKLAANELAVMEARGRKKLQLKIAQLQREEEAEVQAAIKRAAAAGVAEDQIQNMIAGIRKKYRDKEQSESLAFYQNIINKFQEYAGMAISEISFFANLQTQNENNELERDRKLNQAKRENLERRLKSGLITQMQFNREVDRMEREQGKKERELAKTQFERNKRMEAANAFITGQGAVLKAMEIFGPPVPPNFAGIIAFALTEGLTIAKTAAILSQKAPVYAEGGMLGGRSHSAGGNAVIDGRGRKIAEVEAGEGIVNKHTMADRRQYSVTGTPGQIISRLNSMHGVSWEAGAQLIPAWRNFTPPRMNYAAMRNVYAAGGVFQAPNTSENASQSGVFENLSHILSDMQATLQSLQDNGIPAYTVLEQHEKQVARKAAIIKDATMVK